MTLRSYALTLTGSVQRLNSLLVADDIQDVPVYVVDLQAGAANGNPVYVGGSDVASTTGIRIPTPVDAIPEAPYRIGAFDDANVALSDIYVIGTNNDKLRVLVFA